MSSGVSKSGFELHPRQHELEGELARARDHIEELLGVRHSLGEATLRLPIDAEARYRRIVETAQEGIWIVDAHGRTTFVNERAAVMLGETPAEMLGRSLYDFVDDGARDTAERAFAPDACTGGPRDLRLRHKDGRDVWVLASTSPLDDDEGTSVLAMLTDVTARHETEARARFMVEATRVLTAGHDGRTLAQRLAETVVEGGLATACIVDVLDAGDGAPLTAFAHEDPSRIAILREIRARCPATHPRHPQHVAMTTATPIIVPHLDDERLRAFVVDEAQLALVRSIGATTSMHVPLIARGHVIGAMSISSSRKRRPFDEADLAWASDLAGRAAVALDHARLLRERDAVANLLDTVFAQASVGLAFFDRQSRYRRVNAALASIHGVPDGVFIGHTPEEALGREGIDVGNALRTVLRTGEAVHLEGEVGDAGRERFLSGVFYPVRVHGEIVGVGSVCEDVTARKHQELERERLLLREREARKEAEESSRAYRFLAESAPHIVWTATPEGEVDFVNQNFAEYAGLERGHVSAAAYADLVHPDDRAAARPAWLHAVTTGEDFRVQQRIRGKDGTYRWFLVQARAMRDARGAIVRWFGSSILVDELKRAEAEMQALLEGAPIGIALFDTDLRFLRINDALAHINGIPRERHLGQKLPDLLPQLADLIEPTLRHVLATGEPVQDLERSGRPTERSGAEVHSLVSYYPVRVEGHVTGLASIVVDITARKNAELRVELLASAGAVLSSVFDEREMLRNVPRLTVPAFADWCAVYALDGAGRMFLVDALHADPSRVNALWEAFGDRRWLDDGRDGPLSVAHTGTSRLGADDAPFLADEPASERSPFVGTRSWMLVPVVSHGRAYGALGLGLTRAGRGFEPGDLAFAEELGRRVGVAVENARLFELANRERRRAEEAARAKDEFLAMVSHELRTPLNSILGWSRMLIGGGLEPEKEPRALDAIARNAHALAQLVEDLLDVSRIITGKLRLHLGPVPLAVVAAAAVDSLLPAAEAKGVTLKASVAPALPAIRGDADRLQQVIWNLLANAVKFTPRGGRVELGVQLRGELAEITVADTGKGIPPSQVGRVFERFWQAEGGTTRRHGGLGLGLAIVRHIVELHGGTVHADSEGDGRGTTFTVRLPLTVAREGAPLPLAPMPSPSERGARASTHALGGLSVLVVDDEADARDLLRSLLELHGARVRDAASAEEALRVLESEHVDVILSDIGMPGTDGYEFMEQLRARPENRGGRIPAVALTAFARGEDRSRALLAGFHAHLPKPVEPWDLVAALSNVGAPASAP